MRDQLPSAGAAPGLFGNPFFQFGAAALNQAYKPGGNLGGAIQDTTTNLAAYNREQLIQAQAQRELQRQQAVDSFQSSLRGPNAPPWMKNLPAPLAAVVANGPPDQAVQALTGWSGKQQDLDYQSRLLEMQKRIQMETTLQQQQMQFNMLQQILNAQNGGSAPTSQSSKPFQVKSSDDYARLPSGTTYIAPDGTTRRKP